MHLGFDVPWYRQVDHEHGPVAAFFQGPLDGAQANDGQGAGGAADDRVEFVQSIGHVGQSDHPGPKALGQLLATLQGAVGNRHAFGIFGGEMRDRQFDHFARTHEQHADVLQVLEQLPCQTHRRSGHADGMRADFGRTAHLFGHGKGALKQLVQGTAQGAGVFGSAHSILELAQNLGLTQDHAVQAAGHAEGVAGHIVVVQDIGVLAQVLGVDAADVREPLQAGLQRSLTTHPVQLRAVAGGQKSGFGR